MDAMKNVFTKIHRETKAILNYQMLSEDMASKSPKANHDKTFGNGKTQKENQLNLITSHFKITIDAIS